MNRISFNESEFILISASQDGKMKLWDLREKRSCKLTFEGKSESGKAFILMTSWLIQITVRDVSFNPAFHFEFASAFENGTVQVF